MATPIPSNQASMTLDDVLRATGGVTRGTASGTMVVRGFTTDSRAVVPGSAFVALRGETHDGHAFVDGSAAAGASVVVLDRAAAVATAPSVVAVVVEDTLAAWGALARAHLRGWRRRTGGRVLAITGSAGKTTTKELCSALVGELVARHVTPGNLNNRIGVPAVAFGVTDADRVAIFEVGMSVPGEIAALGGIVEPDVAVLLNVGVAHAGGVGGTRADVGREKGALFEALREGGTAIVCVDDDVAVAQGNRARGARIVPFGRAAQADYRLVERTSLPESGSRIVLSLPGSVGCARSMTLILGLPGEAAAMDLAAAVAASEAVLDRLLSEETVASALAKLPRVAGRAAIRRLSRDVLVLDDTYNANPASMRAALDTLDDLARPASRRKVAVLGEMKELGPIGEQEHERLGEELARHRMGLVIGCGGLIGLALDRAARAGVVVVKASDTEEAARFAAEQVRPGDAVLLKGSRGAAVERVWDALVLRIGFPEPIEAEAP